MIDLSVLSCAPFACWINFNNLLSPPYPHPCFLGHYPSQTESLFVTSNLKNWCFLSKVRQQDSVGT